MNTTPRGVWTRTLLCVTVALALAGAAHAERVENTVVGSVLSAPTDAALQALGVSNGAKATLVFEVETETPVNDVNAAGVRYFNGITNWTLTIGSFVATFDPTSLTQVIVTNDSGMPPVDVYTIAGKMNVTDDVLGPIGGSASVSFSEFGNGAISNDDIAQDLNRFDAGTHALAGTVGGRIQVISVIFSGGGPGPGPGPQEARPKCVQKQLAVGADFCEEVLKCLSKQSKKPLTDPWVVQACIDEAEAAFAARFDKAQDKADSKGQVCESVVDGAGAIAQLADDVDPLDALVNTTADPDDKNDAKYRATILKAAAKAVGRALDAYAADAKKPKQKKLDKKLAGIDADLAKAIKKAGKKAQKKGVTPDVLGQDVVDAVADIVDAVRDVTDGEVP